MKKQIALAIAQVQATPYLANKLTVSNAFNEYFAKLFGARWTVTISTKFTIAALKA